jgi:hypothetical protein
MDEQLIQGRGQRAQRIHGAPPDEKMTLFAAL